MYCGRRRRGFERAGSLPADQIGLPERRGRELCVASAWRRVAGDAVSRQAPTLALRRSVLEIRLPDGEWGRTLREMLPRLAGRLAASHPELGVRRFRLIPDHGADPEPALPVPQCAAAPPEVDQAPSEIGSGGTAVVQGEELDRRLEQLRDRYLARGSERA